jgi:hypothetical protein
MNLTNRRIKKMEVKVENDSCLIRKNNLIKLAENRAQKKLL